MDSGWPAAVEHGPYSLLATKLFIPRPRVGLVPRVRLLERLDDGLQGRLTLVSAPAGFGKTMLLAAWARGGGASRCTPTGVPGGAWRGGPGRAGWDGQQRVAWLSLDAGDNDPVRFWSYVIAALQTAYPGMGESQLSALRAARPAAAAATPPVEELLTGLINEIAASVAGHLVLVLDDYHAIDARAIHDGLAFLIDHLPPRMHVVIATRADPPMPISRLRGRGEVVELRTADLRFTPEEAAGLLNDVMGLGLSAVDVAALEARTEGWIAGLQMAALSLRDRDAADMSAFIAAFAGSHRFVLDYLTDEVLSQQPRSVQAFLRRTVVLDRLTGPLCDALAEDPADSGQGNGQQMLERLEAANLFIVALDDERRWYRYHGLFADLLRARLAQTEPELVPVLHRRASGWYETNGLVGEAVRHALVAQDFERAACLVEQNGPAVVFRGELGTLVGWLDALPDDMLRSRPWLSVTHAWALVYTGPLDEADAPLEHAERALSSVEPPGERRRISGHIAAIRGLVIGMRGDWAGSVERAQEALACLPEQDLGARGFVASLLAFAHYWRGDLAAAADASVEASAIARAAGEIDLVVETMSDLAAIQWVRGQLRRAAATCEEALQLAEAHARQTGRRPPVAGYAHAHLSRLMYEWNDVAAAERHARQGLELSAFWGRESVRAVCYETLARALQASGDVAGALDAIEMGRGIAAPVSPLLARRLDAVEAQMRLAEGDLSLAARLLEDSPLDGDDECLFQNRARYLTVARVLAAQGATCEAQRLLERLMHVAEATGAGLTEVEALTVQALALQGQSRSVEALAVLARALSLAEPEGYERTFIDAGPPMSRLLRQAIAQDVVAGYASRLLAALEQETQKTVGLVVPGSTSRRGEDVPVEPFSERELQVLRLLAAGLTNREIAEQLYLAVGTVKKYTSNIYGKLGVRSRTQAAARGRELGLLLG